MASVWRSVDELPDKIDAKRQIDMSYRSKLDEISDEKARSQIKCNFFGWLEQRQAIIQLTTLQAFRLQLVCGASN